LPAGPVARFYQRLRDEHNGGYGHPDALHGTTLNRAERAHRFDDWGEAEQTAARLNGTLIHGGEAVFNDG
jgi:hypothetical protein